MSALQAYATHIASAMDILAEAHGMPEPALLELGLPDVEAREPVSYTHLTLPTILRV